MVSVTAVQSLLSVLALMLLLLVIPLRHYTVCLYTALFHFDCLMYGNYFYCISEICQPLRDIAEINGHFSNGC